MRFTRTKATLAAVGLALSLAACGGDSGDEGHIDLGDVDKASDLSGTPKELADAGSIKIGVKFDQPGIGNKEPGTDTPAGFDIEMGRIIAARLGIPDDKIKWVETVSDNRESFLDNGTVDLSICMSWSTNQAHACNTVVDAIPEQPSQCGCQLLDLPGVFVVSAPLFADGFE